jgi:charged multivesicular body protein 1
MSIVL